MWLDNGQVCILENKQDKIQADRPVLMKFYMGKLVWPLDR